jgi:hypothetical protein
MRVLGPFLLVLLQAGSCGTSSPAASERVAAGAWGGTGIALRVADDGGEVELDCAHGLIEGALTLDADGRFDVKGTLVREHGGPEREGEVLPTEPVRYRGRVEGRHMTLTIVLAETNRELVSYSLIFEARPVLRKCL